MEYNLLKLKTMTIAIIFLFLIGIFMISVSMGASKSNKELEMKLKEPIKFKYITVEKSKFFDNHFTVFNLVGEKIAVVCEGSSELVRNKISIQEFSEIIYLQENFKRIWKQLNMQENLFLEL